MNRHLEPVFNIFLPALEKQWIEYWVYGGISNAAYKNQFFRSNKDVDIFVKAADYAKTKAILLKLCRANSKFKLKDDVRVLKKGIYERPKLEIKIDGDEIMSVVPMYIQNNSTNLVFGNGVYSFDINDLGKVSRMLEGYKFYTPSDDFIKKIFLFCLPARINSKSKDNVKNDAKELLTEEEFKELISNTEK